LNIYPTGKQALDMDRYTQEAIGLPGIVLMEKAADAFVTAIDDKLSALDKHKDAILVVVESGNNGGDGVAIARILTGRGYRVDVFTVAGINRKSESYLKQLAVAERMGVSFVKSADLDAYDIIIDAMFGVGLSKPLVGKHADIAGLINQSKAYKIAVDIPSGICSSTGEVLGAAVRCDMTVTFQCVKYGMLIGDGRVYSGEIRCRDIGIVFSGESDDYIRYEYDDEDYEKLLPRRPEESNKGDFGKVLILAGSEDSGGALYLAASAAYRVGAGLVKVVTDISNKGFLMDKLPEAMGIYYNTSKIMGQLPDYDETMVPENLAHDIIESSIPKEFKDKLKTAVEWADVVMAGPGIGTDTLARVLLAKTLAGCKKGQALILDADALNIISTDVQQLMELSVRVGNVIVTPHMMEMTRLLSGGESSSDKLKELRADRCDIISRFADMYGVAVCLKDARTIISQPVREDKDGYRLADGFGGRGRLYVNTTGNSGMAKGGSGDVLSGIMAGLYAAGHRRSGTDLYTAACLAVRMHGMAGDLAVRREGRYSITARDIIYGLPKLMED